MTLFWIIVITIPTLSLFGLMAYIRQVMRMNVNYELQELWYDGKMGVGDLSDDTLEDVLECRNFDTMMPPKPEFHKACMREKICRMHRN